MRYSRFQLLLITLATLILIPCCTDNPVNDKPQLNLSGTFKPAGLAGISVNHFTLFKGSLYATTDSGIYQLPLNVLTANSWNSLGLHDKKINDVAFLPGDSMLAAKYSEFGTGETTLFLSSDHGKSWQSWQHNYGGDTGKYTYIGALGAAGEQSDTLIALGSGVMVALSVNGGKKWSLGPTPDIQWDAWGGVPERVYADPYYKGRIWYMGVDGFSQPYLFKSINYGTSWTRLDSIAGPAVCYDIATDPNNKEAILAGLSGTNLDALQIRKSMDGGQTWKVVNTGSGIYALTQSPKNGRIAYASGLKMNNSENLFFLASNNFGDTWQTVTDSTSMAPKDIYSHDLVATLINGKEVLFFGTNKGVYKYEFSD